MSFLDRLLRRVPPPMRRHFDAAGGAKRFPPGTHFDNTAAEVAAAAPVIRSRARHLAANNAWCSNGVGNWVGALVGTGHRPVPRIDDPAMRDTLSRAFTAWAEEADATGRFDFAHLQAEPARGMIVDGLGLALMEDDDDGLRVRVLPAEQLDESKTARLSDSRVIVNGIELDATGRPVAFWLHPETPGSAFETARPSARVDAADVIHVFRPLGAGALNGLSWLAPAAVPATELDALTDALLTSAKIAALHTGWVVDQTQFGAAPFGDHAGDTLELSMEPGTVRILPPGSDIKFSSPETMADAPAFVRLHLQQIAAALQLPEHLVSGDVGQANYSSLRAALLPFRQKVEQIQRGTLGPQLFRPVWRRWLATEIMAGRLDADLATPADWLGPRVPHVDPAKDLEAVETSLALGLTSRSAGITEAGRNAEEVDAEIAADRERERALGLSFGRDQ